MCYNSCARTSLGLWWGMTSYFLTEQHTVSGIIYGIGATTKNITVSYTNITDNKDEMLALVRLCNELKLESLHLEDVLEDFIG